MNRYITSFYYTIYHPPPQKYCSVSWLFISNGYVMLWEKAVGKGKGAEIVIPTKHRLRDCF